MKKADLKNGMVVELRNGSRYLVHNGNLVKNSSYITINNFYHNDLCNIYNYFLNIVKVYKSNTCTLNAIFENDNLELLWEREEHKEQLKLSKDDKDVILEALEIAQNHCKKHNKCNDCEFNLDCDCIFNDVEFLDIDKLFKD